MTVYEYYKQMEGVCRDNSKKAEDSRLKKFYVNSAKGFAKKAKELTAEEAEMDCKEKGLCV